MAPPAKHKKALTLDKVHAMIKLFDRNDLPDKRDRAVILIAFWSAMRCSEVANVRVEDLVWCERGVDIFIPRSKTDHAGRGQSVALTKLPGLSLCPIAALQDWLAASGIKEGYVFRALRGCKIPSIRSGKPHGALLRNIVQDGCTRLGLKPEEYGAHSLRSGFATSAFEHGATVVGVQAVLRHRSPVTTLFYALKTELNRTDAARALSTFARSLDEKAAKKAAKSKRSSNRR
jgi:integrase